MRHSLDSKTVGTWQAPEFPFRIDWSVAVLAEIRIAAMDAFLSLPHGGLEIGGVLFGVRERDCVRILAARPLACEHALGPKFVLSTHDRERLRAVLEVGEGNLQPVGWYHSHTRGDLSLDTGDLEIHHSYFRQRGRWRWWCVRT